MLLLLLLLFLLSLLPVLLLYLLPKTKKMIFFAGIRTHDRSTVCFCNVPGNKDGLKYLLKTHTQNYS
jgi:hypothetical protein